MNTYPLADTYVSINGEGPLAGTPAAFLRMKGCNLSCSYCDTAWAREADCPSVSMTDEDILAWLAEQGIRHVTLTGGEPLLIPHIAPLIEAMGQAGYAVEIETNGSVDLAPYTVCRPRPAFTMDYKCPDSGMEGKMHLPNFSLLTTRDTVKFVVSSRRDLDRAREMTEQYHLAGRCHIFFSAVFDRIEPKTIAAYMTEHRLNDVRLQLQMHKYIWPPQERSV